jgi:phage-related protein
VTHGDKPLVWLHGEVKTPPFSPTARLEAGYLLRQLQMSNPLGCRGRGQCRSSVCHELRIQDAGITWRLIYRTDPDAVVILDVFAKKTRARCRRRLRDYENA